MLETLTNKDLLSNIAKCKKCKTLSVCITYVPMRNRFVHCL